MRGWLLYEVWGAGCCMKYEGLAAVWSAEFLIWWMKFASHTSDTPLPATSSCFQALTLCTPPPSSVFVSASLSGWLGCSWSCIIFNTNQLDKFNLGPFILTLSGQGITWVISSSNLGYSRKPFLLEDRFWGVGGPASNWIVVNGKMSNRGHNDRYDRLYLEWAQR
jgi:hypothetical protein